MEFFNCQKIIHFQLQNLNYSLLVVDLKLENTYVQHLQVIINKLGHQHGRFVQY